jgi:hypothetical protein
VDNNLEVFGLPQINSVIIHVEEVTLLTLYKEKCINEIKQNKTKAENNSIKHAAYTNNTDQK